VEFVEALALDSFAIKACFFISKGEYGMSNAAH